MEEDNFARNNRNERLELMGQIAERSEKLLQAFTTGSKQASKGIETADPLSLAPIIHELMSRMVKNPTSLIETQLTLWQNYIELWQKTSKRLLGQSVVPMTKPSPGDRRFRDADWDDDAIFNIIKQSYLLTTRWMAQTVEDFDELDQTARQKIDFYTRQFVDAIVPSHVVTTNPEILRATLASGGDNLLRGLNHLLMDLERGPDNGGDEPKALSAFELGKTIASTPGKVVFQNDLMQLIHYEPATESVYKHPLLMIPPWINKYYIFDLQAENSLVKFALDQGFAVFVISWADPVEHQTDKSFERYVLEGPIAALDAMASSIGKSKVNAVGYGLGGTLLAATLGYMEAKQDRRIKSATLLNTLTDFENPGELGVFINEEQLAAIDQPDTDEDGVDNKELAATYSMLRANDLIWSFVIDNYLFGDEPLPFDLLHWNADTTAIPHALHGFYLQDLYQKNMLVRPDGIILDGVPIDLGKVRTPIYMLSAREDHIAPWMSTYAATQVFRGKVTFVLTGSGHIRGILNPPGSSKHGHWLNDNLPADPKDWLEGATQKQGSWWQHWQQWLAGHAGVKVEAKQPGKGKLGVIEAAPGRYATGKTV